MEYLSKIKKNKKRPVPSKVPIGCNIVNLFYVLSKITDISPKLCPSTLFACNLAVDSKIPWNLYPLPIIENANIGGWWEIYSMFIGHPLI